MPPLRNLRPRTTEERRITNTLRMQRFRNSTLRTKNQCKHHNIGRNFQETETSIHHTFDTTHVCTYCNAKLFSTETQETCCKSGKIKLASAGDTTSLKNLFMRNDNIEKDFCENIRAYNSIFAFTSMGVKLDKPIAS
ncbi:5048_t:CDS:2, partial [Racocetra fulgida]